MKHAFATGLSLCLLLLLSVGCGQQAAEEGPDDSAAELQQVMSIRDAAEEAYATAMTELAPVEEEDPERFIEESKRITMDREGQYDVYTDQLVTYINNNPESQEAKSAYADYLAKFVAPPYITEMGNYIKAVEVLEEALALDPGNAEITALRDKASSLRFMTQERFDTVNKGMIYEEVETICGVANPKHIIEKVERGKTLVGWFYPTADRGAAGIYFSDGKVYNLKFDAIKAPEVRKPDGSEEVAE